MMRFPPKHSEFGAFGVHTTENGAIVEYWDGHHELDQEARSWLAQWFLREIAALPQNLEDTMSFVYVVLTRQPKLGDDFRPYSSGPILTYSTGCYPSTPVELPEVPIPQLYEAAARFLTGDIYGGASTSSERP